MGKWKQIAETIPEEQLQGQTENIGKWARLAQEHDKQQQPAQPEPLQDMPWGEVALSAVKSIPESAYGVVKDIVTPFVQPVETAKALMNLALGVIEKVPGATHLTPGPRYQLEGEGDPRREAVDATIEYFQDRYGSLPGFKKAVAEDPIGVATDLSTVLTGGGGTVKGVGKATKLRGAEKLGNVIAKTGLQLEPYNIAKLPFRAAKLGAVRIPKITPSELYESAAKFRTTLQKSEREAIVKTALDKQILPTYKGLDKLNDKINGLNIQIQGLIDKAEATNTTIPLDTLFKDFADLHEKARLSGTPVQARNAIRNIRKQIEEANSKIVKSKKTIQKPSIIVDESGQPFLVKKEKTVKTRVPKRLSPAEYQRLKQNIYKEIATYYSSVANSPASVKAQKAVARQAKIALEELIPEIKGLNKAEGDLLALKKEIDRAATRIGNRDILSLGTTAKAAGGGVVAGGAGLATGLALGLLDSQPVVKARLALLLHRMKQRGMKVRITPTVARLFAAQAGQSTNEQNE